MSTPADDAPPKLLEHLTTVYQAMFNEAKLMVDKDEKEMLVYEGKLTELITKTCYLSVPYYTKVTHALKGMNCMYQLKRGGGSAPSQWVLMTEPTLELFNTYMDLTEGKVPRRQYASKAEVDDVRQAVDEILAAVQHTEAQYQEIIEALKKHFGTE
jgi:hypothetical protein